MYLIFKSFISSILPRIKRFHRFSNADYANWSVKRSYLQEYLKTNLSEIPQNVLVTKQHTFVSMINLIYRLQCIDYKLSLKFLIIKVHTFLFLIKFWNISAYKASSILNFFLKSCFSKFQTRLNNFICPNQR